MNEPLFSNQSGVYPLPATVAAADIEREAQQRKFRFVDLNGQAVTNRHELFQVLQSAFEFPAHFGHNWDALLDMLRDLSWFPAPGYVVLVHNFGSLSERDHTVYQHFIGVLTDAAAFHADRLHNKPPMIVLLADPTPDR